MTQTKYAISVRGASKAYTIAHNAQKHTTLGEVAMHRLRNPFHRVHKETFWALKDVSFDIEEGQIAGIIGRNGAGKSTLLKIISRITAPTTGRINLYGRVGSLLEVGTGFHPELTGRENIYLNGCILGMRRGEIAKQFDAIVDFAEVEKFLDTPVKRYSSGMYVRLAFAVAAYLDSEILIVDEVLAVGDARFQKKCLGKMDQVAHNGRTVLLVTHNIAVVQHLCKTGIVLEGGRIVFRGTARDCCQKYTEQVSSDTVEIIQTMRSRTAGLTLLKVLVNGSVLSRQTLPAMADRLHISVEGEVTHRIPIDMEVRMFDDTMAPLAYFSTGTDTGKIGTVGPGRFTLERVLCLPRIFKGKYCLRIALIQPAVDTLTASPGEVELHAEGRPMACGGVLDYSLGWGWMLLDAGNKEGPAEKQPISTKTSPTQS